MTVCISNVLIQSLLIIVVLFIGSSVTENNSANKSSSSSSPKPKFKTSAKAHNKNAAFLSMMTDSSSTGAKLIAEVVNQEVNAAAYTVHLLNCSDNIPITKIELQPAIEKVLPPISNLSTQISRVELTPPQQSKTFTIDLNFEKSTKKLIGKAACLVSILNRFNEKLATKLVNFSPDDSCICAAKCACTCFKDDEILECKVISDEEIVAEWLKSNRSKIPSTSKDASVVSPHKNNKVQDNSPSLVSVQLENFKYTVTHLDESHLRYLCLFLIIIILLVLLILGTCKGLCGICVFPIGRCGLSIFYDNYEKKYSGLSVVHDSEGYPLDPNTRDRTVKRLNPTCGFLLNVIFFLCCPLFCFLWMKSRCCDTKEKKYVSPYDKEEREPSFRPSSTIFGNVRKRSAPRSTAKTPEKQASQMSKTLNANTSSSVRRSSVDHSSSKLDHEHVDEGELTVFHHSEPAITAAYAQIYMNKKESSPMLTPLPSSSTYLKQLNQAIQPQPVEVDPYKKLQKDEANLQGQWGSYQSQCCRGTYGSWHRAPAIFNDSFDMTTSSAFDMSRRRPNINPIIDRMGFQVESNDF